MTRHFAADGIAAVTASLLRLFRDAEPSVLEDLLKRTAKLPRYLFASFLGQFFKPTYIAMGGTSEHVAELCFVPPKGSNEFLAALRAYEANID
jgi:hypothetical protein